MAATLQCAVSPLTTLAGRVSGANISNGLPARRDGFFRLTCRKSRHTIPPTLYEARYADHWPAGQAVALRPSPSWAGRDSRCSLPAARGRQRFALVGVAQRRAAARSLLVSRSRWLARRRQSALMAALSPGSTPVCSGGVALRGQAAAAAARGGAGSALGERVSLRACSSALRTSVLTFASGFSW